MSPDEHPSPPVIAVIDTSVLIEFKQVVGIEQQWDLLMEMSARVTAGAVAFPRQVVAELSAVRHPDAPGAWIASAKRSMCHPEPAEETLVRVLAVAHDLVEVDNPNDAADPYVVAMALELAERHPESRVVLVTNDVVDRLPVKIALKTACDRVGVPSCPLESLIAWLNDPTAPLPPHADLG